MIWFGWGYGISTIVGYLMPNPLYTYISNIYDLVWFYGISTIVGYLTPYPFYTYILNLYDLVWLGFMNLRTHLNGFKCCYVSLTIQLTISYLFIHS